MMPAFVLFFNARGEWNEDDSAVDKWIVGRLVGELDDERGGYRTSQTIDCRVIVQGVFEDLDKAIAALRRWECKTPRL